MFPIRCPNWEAPWRTSKRPRRRQPRSDRARRPPRSDPVRRRRRNEQARHRPRNGRRPHPDKRVAPPSQRSQKQRRRRPRGTCPRQCRCQRQRQSQCQCQCQRQRQHQRQRQRQGQRQRPCPCPCPRHLARHPAFRFGRPPTSRAFLRIMPSSFPVFCRWFGGPQRTSKRSSRRRSR